MWRGSLVRGGYGITVESIGNHQFRTVGSHRFSWKLHNGDIPDGLYVLHKCNVCACVNPKHLYLGNDADNMRDKVKSGNSDYGDRNNHVKLIEDQVLEIRRLHKITKCTCTKLASIFNVGRSAISRIVRYKNWIYPRILEREQNGQ